MIRDQHERAIAPQMLLSNNLETAIGAQECPNDQRHERAQPVNEHVRFARKIPQPLDQRLIEIGGGRVLPFLHRSS